MILNPLRWFSYQVMWGGEINRDEESEEGERR
jgi:hypothetical protein